MDEMILEISNDWHNAKGSVEGQLRGLVKMTLQMRISVSIYTIQAIRQPCCILLLAPKVLSDYLRPMITVQPIPSVHYYAKLL